RRSPTRRGVLLGERQDQAVVGGGLGVPAAQPVGVDQAAAGGDHGLVAGVLGGLKGIPDDLHPGRAAVGQRLVSGVFSVTLRSLRYVTPSSRIRGGRAKKRRGGRAAPKVGREVSAARL